jgi:nucleoside 2-deoxyribosyltransferase
MKKVYVIGSLRNPDVPFVAAQLREAGFDVFDDWYAAGPEADDHWKKYEESRGHTYEKALDGFAANHVFSYDKFHLDSADAAVLVLPAGRSAHLEAGYMIGKGRPVFILLDEVSGNLRWDVMYKFAAGVTRDISVIADGLKRALAPENDPALGPLATMLSGPFQAQGPALGAAGNWRDIAQKEIE